MRCGAIAGAAQIQHVDLPFALSIWPFSHPVRFLNPAMLDFCRMPHGTAYMNLGKLISDGLNSWTRRGKAIAQDDIN